MPNRHIALMAAGAGTILSTSLSLFMKLPEATVDVTPWVHWRVPMIARSSMTDDDSGPVLVSVEYDVQPEKTAQFCDLCGSRCGKPTCGAVRDAIRASFQVGIRERIVPEHQAEVEPGIFACSDSGISRCHQSVIRITRSLAITVLL